MKPNLFRAAIFHTPRNPFTESAALEVHSDGGLLVENGHVSAIGDFIPLLRANPDARTHDWRGGFILPGFVDAHIHFPQVRVLGALGESLLDWLRHSALPEEARMQDTAYAKLIAREFLNALACHGTTSAMVFGAHFAPAVEMLFEQAFATGIRVASGLVLSDRNLLDTLHVSPDDAYQLSKGLIARFHDRDGLAYAVTPRFALSTSEPMLEVCRTLMTEHPTVRFQTHLNENLEEIDAVLKLFPWALDYLAVYEKFGLVEKRSILAHNVHCSDSTTQRIASQGAAVAHCPSSNAALGSGLFAMRRHVSAGVRIALGTDVGAGTGFSMLKEGLQAYLMQRVAPEGMALSPAHLLYLATRAGAEALGFDDTGDLQPGRSADFVCLKPPGEVLNAVIRHAESPERVLAALFTLAGAESVMETWVRGKCVYQSLSVPR